MSSTARYIWFTGEQQHVDTEYSRKGLQTTTGKLDPPLIPMELGVVDTSLAPLSPLLWAGYCVLCVALCLGVHNRADKCEGETEINQRTRDWTALGESHRVSDTSLDSVERAGGPSVPESQNEVLANAEVGRGVLNFDVGPARNRRLGRAI